jgi:probable F420-dependent oxidoreductase
VGSTHAFRFGIQVSQAESATAWRDFARKAEDLGYSSVTMPDHFVDMQLAPMPAMALAAAATTTLRVGTLVADNDYKHPAIFAKEIATLDLLTDGRVECGIGAGWMATDYDALGLPYDSAGTRIARLEEALAVINGSWGPGLFDFDGAHYTIKNYDGLPKPVQLPRPPILIGGGGPKVLRLAGREADIVGINPNLRRGAITADAVQTSVASETLQKIGWIREGAGERFDDIELQIRFFLTQVSDDRAAVGETWAPGFGITGEELLGSGFALVGTIDESEEQLLRQRDEWGVTYIVVGADTYESIAPLVARLAGT